MVKCVVSGLMFQARRLHVPLLCRIVIVTLALSFAGVNPSRLSASEGHDHDVSSLPQITITSLDEAVNAVAYFHREVEAHIVASELAKVHVSAFAARDSATSITEFTAALSDDKPTQIAAIVQRIGALAIQLDKYGDAGKAPETAVFARKLKDEVDAVQRVTGVTIRLDWKPKFVEGTLTGGSAHGASKCPHKANHGGRFSLALNDAYHVEGSYPEAEVFRMHFYDKDSCPISAQGFSGRILFQQGNQQMDLKQAGDGTHLIVRLPSPMALPVSVTAIINLPDPHTGVVSTEHFSYNFYKLSKSAPAFKPGPMESSITSGALIQNVH